MYNEPTFLGNSGRFGCVSDPALSRSMANRAMSTMRRCDARVLETPDMRRDSASRGFPIRRLIFQLQVAESEFHNSER